MNVSESKLINFENKVMQEAQQKKAELLGALAAEKQEKLTKIEAELREQAERTLKRELVNISKAKNEQVVHEQLLCKQQVLSERQSLISGVFDSVAGRLAAFARSPEYQAYLFDAVAAAKESLPTAKTVRIVKNDEAYASALEKLGFEVEYLGNSEIGGFVLVDKNNGMQIDETLLTKLRSAQSSFLETYNLKI